MDNAVQSLETIIQMKHMKIEEILEFRRLTECEAARLASERRTAEDLEKMKEILQRSENVLGESDAFLPVIWSFIWHWQMHPITQCIPL